MLHVWGKNEKQFVLVVECIGFRYGEYFQESKMVTVAILDIRSLATFDLCGIHRCVLRQVRGGGGVSVLRSLITWAGALG